MRSCVRVHKIIPHGIEMPNKNVYRKDLFLVQLFMLLIYLALRAEPQEQIIENFSNSFLIQRAYFIVILHILDFYLYIYKNFTKNRYKNRS